MQYKEIDVMRESYNKLDDVQKEILSNWINRWLSPIRYINGKHTSDELRNQFEKSKRGFEITNNQMKFGMLSCGFKGNDIKNSKDMAFNVSESSRLFKEL